MANDILGYDRTANAPGTVMTGDYALLDLGGRVGLLQQVSVEYGQQVETFREVGSADLFWITGEPMGSLTAASAVSNKGFFDGLPKGICGSIEKAVVSLGGKGNCAAANVTSSSALHIKDAVTKGLGVQISAGSRPITQNISMVFAYLAA
jgi:hypothetical protein